MCEVKKKILQEDSGNGICFAGIKVVISAKNIERMF